MGESESGSSDQRVIQVGHTSTFLTVARDALIILALAVLGGDIVALAVNASTNFMRARIAVIAAIVLCGIVGFFISGYRTPRKRWVHLLRVTACVWLFICGVLLSMAYVDVAQPGIPIGACVLCGVFLLVTMGIGGAISFALRKDPGDSPMRAGSEHASTRTPQEGASAGYRVNYLKVAVVLSSTPFFFASCTGIEVASIPVIKHIGGKYMARGDAPDRNLMVIASIPNPAMPGQRMVDRVTLGSLPEFQREHPDHSFVIPALSGEIYRNGASTSYRATALRLGEVRVETDTRYDDPFGLSVVGSYEASEHEVRPIHTNATVAIENLFFGVTGAGTLSLIGSILKSVQRRRQQRDASSFFNRSDATRGFVILGAVLGMCAFIFFVPHLLVGHSQPPELWVMAALAPVCWVAASATSLRIGPGVASVLWGACPAAMFLCMLLLSERRYPLAFPLGLTALATGVVLRRFRKYW